MSSTLPRPLWGQNTQKQYFILLFGELHFNLDILKIPVYMLSPYLAIFCQYFGNFLEKLWHVAMSCGNTAVRFVRQPLNVTCLIWDLFKDPLRKPVESRVEVAHNSLLSTHSMKQTRNNNHTYINTQIKLNCNNIVFTV